MIKIIKKGTRRVEQCEVCGCIFSFDEEDIETKGHKRIVRCPQRERVIDMEATR